MTEEKYTITNAIGVKIEVNKDIIPIKAKNRKALVNVTKQITSGMRFFNTAKSKILIRINCPNCDVIHDFKHYKDIPNKSLKCKCGAWLIKYDRR